MPEYNKDFYYRKQIEFNENGKRYYWYLVHKQKREGVHFHGFVDNISFNTYGVNKYGFMPWGIECHRKSPIYDGQTPIKECWVTKGDCFCDGSSLQAQEVLGHIDPENEMDDNFIWITLHDYYENWIDKD